ncbi:MAG: ABC transporter permease [Clostridia bacterium]|nr:ABC transporter permease [Clostridia bacterium]
MDGKIRNTIVKYSLVALLILLWEAAPRFGWIDNQFIPSFTATLLEVKFLWLNGDLFAHIMVSLWRSFNGLLAAVAIAIPLGTFLGRRSSAFMDTLNPLFRMLAQFNPFSLMPVFILFFGIGEVAKLAIVAWVSIWPVLFNTVTGVRMVDANLIKSAKALNISEVRLLTKVVLPAAAPSIFSGIRVGVEISFFMLIAAEMIGAHAGLGWLMHNSAMNYHIPRIYAAGLGIVTLGVILNQCLRDFQKRFFFWKDASPIFHSGGEKKKVKRLGKVRIAFILAAFTFFIFVGTLEVNRINREGSSPQHHNNLQMDPGGTSY